MLIYRMYWTREGMLNSCPVKCKNEDDMADLMNDFIKRKGMDKKLNKVYFLPEKEVLNG